MAFPDGNPHRRIIAERFSIIEETNPTYPALVRIPINCSIEDLQRCIIVYGSNNRREKTEKAIANLLQELITSGYCGHLLFRIGGWPNMESGCLTHCHVPWGFKPCAFLEALQLGYRQALWLDISLHILKPLESLFTWIEQNGALYRYSYWDLNYFANDLFMKSFSLTAEEVITIPHIASGVLGFDLTNESARSAIKAWHASCIEENGFFTFFPDQLPLSVIMKRFELSNNEYTNLVKIRNEDINQCYFLQKY